MADERLAGHFLHNTFGDRYLYELNGTAFNKVGAEVCFSQHYGDSLFAENSLYIVCGSDSGLLPKYIVEHGVPDGSYYIFVERPEVLEVLTPVIPEGGFHKKIILATIDDWLARANEIEYQNFVYLGNLQFIQSFAVSDGRYTEYLEFASKLQEDLEKIRWRLNAELGSEVFSLRQLENLAENRKPTTVLKDAFHGKTAIVLAGGPSLDEALPWLLEQRQHLAVFAVSRIARRLLEVGISPDFIVSIDPTNLSFDISKEMLNMWEETIFLNKYHVVPSLLGQWGGRSFFGGERIPWASKLNDGLQDIPGPTVTNSAIDLAIMMGFKRVFLAGVDLCLSRDGYTHAKGSNERQTGPQLGQGQLWVETNSGALAETRPDFHFASERVNFRASEAKKTGCQIINLSGGAIRLKAVAYVPTAEIDLDKEIISVSSIVSAVSPAETSAERKAYYQQVLTELLRAEGVLREIRKLAKTALKANESFFGKRKGIAAGQKKYKAKMDRIDKKFKNDFSDFTHLVKKFGIRDFLKMTHGDRDREWERDDVERLGRYYYEAYDRSAGRLLKFVSLASARMRARLEEETSSPDFQLLINQWREDGLPGRSLLWSRLHADGQMPEEIANQFSQLSAEFEKTMQLQETGHLQKSRQGAELGPVRAKLQMMFKRRQGKNLQHMVASLEQLEGVEAKSVACLGRGYLAELENKPQQAVNEYQQIIELQDGQENLDLLEDTLRRLLSLFLKQEDLASAKVVAECLVGISVVNVPYYADLMWLLGEKRTALDAYADYLEQIPADTGAMIKVGRYYLEEGLAEGAAMMFEAVLEQDPWNKVAHKLLENLEAE